MFSAGGVRPSYRVRGHSVPVFIRTQSAAKVFPSMKRLQPINLLYQRIPALMQQNQSAISGRNITILIPRKATVPRSFGVPNSIAKLSNGTHTIQTEVRKRTPSGVGCLQQQDIFSPPNLLCFPLQIRGFWALVVLFAKTF